MALSRRDFSKKALPDLILNTHTYTHNIPKTTSTLQYAKWYCEIAAEQWLLEYLNFTFVMESIIYRNENFFDFDNIQPCDKHLIYEIVRK